MKSEHNTIVRHSSMRLPETTAQITQEGHSIRLHNKRLHNRARTVKAWTQAFLLAPFLVLAGCGRSPNAVTPSIAITSIPSADGNKYDTVAAIEGTAVGLRPDQQIVLYTRSEELWWVQPGADRPFTQIQNGSRWQNQVHLGTEYAALLVEPGYHPPETAESLPSKGDGVDAIAVVQDKRAAASSTQPKLLHFSGYDWTVRTAASNRAGTRNSFDPANAWTDARGALHLRIARRKDKWTCAEVKLTRSLGYGTYTFAVRDTSQLEPSAVLTLLTWDGIGGEPNHRELDVEISRWGYLENENAHYVVQPYFIPANVLRFRVPGGALKHSFHWKPGRVTFSTLAESPARVIQQDTFTSGVPSADGNAVRMNLYVFNKGEVPLKHEMEVVIDKFEFFP